MLLILAPSNVAFPGNLSIQTVPRRFLTLGRRVYPRRVLGGLFWRTVFEAPVARYMVALSIFPIALLFRPEWALPISLAPVPMAMFVMVFESYVLSVPSRAARRALIDPVEADRGLDLLHVRANEVLTRIAAGRKLTEGTLHLVIEQSELLRIPPLTYVSVQQDGPEPAFLDLDDDEQTQIRSTLFDGDLDERKLRLISVAQNTPIRTFALEAGSVSAHARLAALAASGRG